MTPNQQSPPNMKMTRLELYQSCKKLNSARGGNDWQFERDNRLFITQGGGGVECIWFDVVSGIYRRSYFKGVTLV